MKFLTENVTETSRKHYGSASAWIFFTETIFLTSFERIQNTKRAEHFYSALFPLFIGEKREVVAAQLAQASWVASTRRHRLLLEPSRRPKWAWFLFAPPFSLNTPPLCFFLLISFWNVAELFGLRNDSCFPSGMLRNFTDYVTMHIFPFGMLRNFMDYATMLVSRVLKGANKVQGPTASTPGRN